MKKSKEGESDLKIKKFVLGVLIILCICAMPGYRQALQIAAKLSVPMTLVIDPGHGGPDSGAVASDGTVEKNINLAISKALKKEAEKYGVRVVLTRDSDAGLYGEDNSSGRWLKLGDLKERKRIIDEAAPDLMISIHLNSFQQDSKVRGAQVFYPKNGTEEVSEENKSMAEKIQKSLTAGINDGTDRIVLPKSDIYLFKNVDSNMVLVECGFLSNPEDLANLKSEAFQQKLAKCIMDAIADQYSLKIQKSHTNKVIASRTNNS